MPTPMKSLPTVRPCSDLAELPRICNADSAELAEKILCKKMSTHAEVAAEFFCSPSSIGLEFHDYAHTVGLSLITLHNFL